MTPEEIDKRLAKLTTAAEARNLAANARRLGQPELAENAHLRGLDLRAREEGYNSPAAREIALALYLYEEEQTRVLGRKYHASRTRRMLREHGPLHAAERMVMNPRPSKAYRELEDIDRMDLSYEAIIVRFPEEFDPDAVRAARARLAGEDYRAPAQRRESITRSLAPMQRDDQAIHFLRGFRSPDNWQVEDWLPKYRDTLTQVADAVAKGDYDLVATRVWRKMDNHIAHAGQGLVAFEQVDQLWEPLKDVLRDIAADGSPESFDRVVATFEQYKQRGQTDKLPMVLIGRAFAALHPDRYHTTVHDRKQDIAIDWFAQHTGFAQPSGNWATRASALCEHLSQWPEFRGEGGRELRNIFPWYVYDRLVRSTGAVEPYPSEDEPRSEYSQYERTAQTVQMDLRHNKIQMQLKRELEDEFGEGRVFIEEQTGAGGRVDILVRHISGRPHLYEIKVAGTAAQAAREAIGQLLEYAYRKSGLHPERMVIVSEPELDDVTEVFLAHLRERFQLPLYYRQVKLQ